MKEEYYLVYCDIKGQKDSAGEAILLGEMSPELLDALEVDIKENNANDDVGEVILDKKQNLSHREKERLDNLALNHLWRSGLKKSNPVLSQLKNYFQKCNTGHEEAEFWEVVTGRQYPPEHYVLRTVEEIQWAKNVIASFPQCSDPGCDNRNAMVDYALRLIWLYESWLPPTGIRWSFTIHEMFLYFRRCLAWTGNDYSDEKILDLLNLNNEHKDFIQRDLEQDNNLQETYYVLTSMGRVRAFGSIKSKYTALPNPDAPVKTISVNTEPSTDANFILDKLNELTGAVKENTEKMENSVFWGTYRSQARFGEPEEEVEIEKVRRLKKDGWKWENIVLQVYPDSEHLCADDFKKEIERVKKMYQREYGQPNLKESNWPGF